MATDIHKINVKLEMENAKLLKKLDQSTKKLTRFEKNTRDSFSRISTAVKVAGGAIVAAVGGIGVGKILQVNREMESLRASLVTVTGSAKNADNAFQFIKKFASTTPFDLQQVTGAFIKLQSLGLTPSEEALTSYGNTASAMGKSLNQLIEAVADAATGEFERLKEFGIKAKKQGEQVTFTFQGVKTVVKNNAKDIEGYLQRLGQVEFAGGMERQARTLNGVISNLEDAWNNLMDAVLDEKRNGLVVRFLKSFTKGIDELRKQLEGTSTKVLFNEIKAIQSSIKDIDVDLGRARLFRVNPFLSDEELESRKREYLNRIDEIHAQIKEIEKPVVLDLPEIEPKEEEPASVAASTVLPPIGGSVAKSIEDANGHMAEWVRLQGQALSVYETTRTPLENLKTEIEQYTQLLESGLISQDTFSRAVAQSNQAYLDTQRGIKGVSEKTEEAMTKMDEFAKQAAGNMQTAFADFLFDPFDKGLSGMLRGLADTLRRMTAEVLAQQALSGIFKAGASAFSGSAAGDLFGTFAANVKHGGGMAGAGVFRDVPSIAFANAPRFHSGGIAANEVPAILQKGEEVLTANDPRHRNNGGGNVVNLTINATDGPSVLRSRAQIERELMAGINRAQRNA